jgi:hypothetical protein
VHNFLLIFSVSFIHACTINLCYEVSTPILQYGSSRTPVSSHPATQPSSPASSLADATAGDTSLPPPPLVVLKKAWGRGGGGGLCHAGTMPPQGSGGFFWTSAMEKVGRPTLLKVRWQRRDRWTGLVVGCSNASTSVILAARLAVLGGTLHVVRLWVSMVASWPWCPGFFSFRWWERGGENQLDLGLRVCRSSILRCGSDPG